MAHVLRRQAIPLGLARTATSPTSAAPIRALCSQGYPIPNSTSGGGDGLNSAAYTFPGNDPTTLKTYIFKLDYKISADGNHSLFVRGNLQNDKESQPPQFPGLPPNSVVTNNSKGIAGGYT